MRERGRAEHKHTGTHICDTIPTDHSFVRPKPMFRDESMAKKKESVQAQPLAVR